MHFEPDEEFPWIQFPANGGGKSVTILRPDGESEEYKLGKGKNARPAPIFRVVDHDDGDREKRLTVTSTRLWNVLEKARAALGNYFGVRMEIIAKGKEKDRTYSIDVDEKAAEQKRLGA